MKRYARVIVAMIVSVCAGSPGYSEGWTAVDRAVRSIFVNMPSVSVERDLRGFCGANGRANTDIFYCTSESRIYIRDGFVDDPRVPYAFAHIMGHAAQVQHGVADIAFRLIQERKDEEAMLRGLVTRQVECLAGVFYANAGFPKTSIRAFYGSEPFTGSHWGRRPVGSGPRVSIGLDVRDEWFQKGQTLESPLACSVDELSAAPLQMGLR
ncbi:MAG: hypothetical protein AAGJ34_11695 [Pseudomonadota bacterium]